MNLSQTAKLLSMIAAFNNRTIGEADVAAWQSVLPDVELPDAEEAVRRHYAENTEWLMPAHVRHLVRDIVQEREDLARATPWAPGQHGVLKADAMPEVLGPVDESAITPPVRALLESVRAMLPEGSREALMPRRVAWEREHRAFVRTRDGEPNPLYRPMTYCPGGLQAYVDNDHDGVLRHQDGSFCGHSQRCDDCGDVFASADLLAGHRHLSCRHALKDALVHQPRLSRCPDGYEGCHPAAPCLAHHHWWEPTDEKVQG
jgi:hypothetical protein